MTAFQVATGMPFACRCQMSLCSPHVKEWPGCRTVPGMPKGMGKKRNKACLAVSTPLRGPGLYGAYHLLQSIHQMGAMPSVM